jgi:hypothetical protein
MASIYRGACFCGEVEIRVRGSPIEMGYCHCRSCRAYTGLPVTAFTLWRDEDVSVLNGAEILGSFNKVGTSNRRFCTRCGGHLFTEHPGFGFTDVYAAVLPQLVFKPTVHLNYTECVLPIRDGLPKLRDFPVHAGGSGEEMPEI